MSDLSNATPAPLGGAASGTPAVEMDGIVKTFGPVTANAGATLSVGAGEIHALVGENGAGKSTLMRVLGGGFAPDAGTVRVLGRDVTGWSTQDAIRAGVGIVHQHFMLVPTLTVAENVVLGSEPRRGLQLDGRRALDEVRALSERSGLRVPADRTVAELSVGEAQRVEILKTLYRGARILVLDEPTAVLSPPEVEELWTVLRRMRGEGATIVIITHKLDEVMAISDRITVMRHGRTVERLATADTTPTEIARAMVGRDVVLPSFTSDAVKAAGEGALQVRDLTVRDARGVTVVDSVSFDVAPGEILGIAGVEGNGQTELLEALAGLRAAVGGVVRIDGRDVGGTSVRRRADAGLSHIPEDRHRRGLILDYSVADNLVLGQQHHFARRGVMDRAAVARNAAEKVAAFDIRPPSAALPARALSGGNQQKIVIAREMGRDFRVLLAAQPTRGVDVGAIEFIHGQLREARAAGKAVLLVSADLQEVLALADRVAVMYGGRFVAVLPRAAASEEVLGRYMTGAQPRNDA
ncbi:MAG: putative transporter ATP-binding protein [Gemmatimonadetes bacterium]|nr:putative transporter ATP-binding protein [Gemmatimonadota bacterium]